MIDVPQSKLFTNVIRLTHRTLEGCIGVMLFGAFLLTRVTQPMQCLPCGVCRGLKCADCEELRIIDLFLMDLKNGARDMLSLLGFTV